MVVEVMPGNGEPEGPAERDREEEQAASGQEEESQESGGQSDADSEQSEQEGEPPKAQGAVSKRCRHQPSGRPAPKSCRPKSALLSCQTERFGELQWTNKPATCMLSGVLFCNKASTSPSGARRSYHRPEPTEESSSGDEEEEDDEPLSKRASWNSKHEIPKPTAPARTRTQRFPKIPRWVLGASPMAHETIQF